MELCMLACLQSLADCEVNPMTKNLLASPTAAMHFKVLALKMVSAATILELRVLFK